MKIESAASAVGFWRVGGQYGMYCFFGGEIGVFSRLDWCWPGLIIVAPSGMLWGLLWGSSLSSSSIIVPSIGWVVLSLPLARFIGRGWLGSIVLMLGLPHFSWGDFN